MTRFNSSSRGVEFAVLSLVLSFGLVTGCGGDQTGPVSDGPVEFAADSEAVRFVRSVRESLAQRQRPGNAQVQRLKDLGGRYPDEPLIEETLISILPALRDWDGLATYLAGKSQLDTGQRVTLAKVYVNLGDYSAAAETIQPLAKVDPPEVEANAIAGRAHYLLGENGKAAFYFERVWDEIIEQQRPDEIAFRSMIYFDEGRPDLAKGILEESLVTSPDSIALHNSLARVLAAEGDADGAARHSARVSELQDLISRTERNQMLRAAQTLALNETLRAGDMDECQRLIYEFLPGAEASFQEELYSFLAGLYKAMGREGEASSAVARAREYARREGQKE